MFGLPPWNPWLRQEDKYGRIPAKSGCVRYLLTREDEIFADYGGDVRWVYKYVGKPRITSNPDKCLRYVWNHSRDSYDLICNGRCSKPKRKSCLRIKGPNEALIQLLKRQKFLERDRFCIPVPEPYSQREWDDLHPLTGIWTWTISSRGLAFEDEDEVYRRGPEENPTLVVVGSSGRIYVYDSVEEAYWNMDDRVFTNRTFSEHRHSMLKEKKIQETKTASRIFDLIRREPDFIHKKTAYVLFHP